MVDARQRAHVHGHVVDAVTAGATVLEGGVLHVGVGFWYPATVLTGVTRDMRIMRDETFGPVAPVRVVNSFDEGLAEANDSAVGLGATVFTGSAENAERCIDDALRTVGASIWAASVVEGEPAFRGAVRPMGVDDDQ